LASGDQHALTDQNFQQQTVGRAFQCQNGFVGLQLCQFVPAADWVADLFEPGGDSRFADCFAQDGHEH
jgi:hypothetical protein